MGISKNRRLARPWVALLVALLIVGSAGAAAQLPRPVARVLTGVLSVVWVDYRDGREGGAIFTLTTPDGDEFRLDARPEDAAALAFRAGQTVTVYIGGEVTPASPGEPPLVRVTAVDPQTLALPATRPVLGHTKWVSIGCQFPDRPNPVRPISYFDEMFGAARPGLNHYWREQSYGRIWLDGSHAAGWYTLPQPYAAYFNDGGTFLTSKLATDCLAAADADLFYPDYYGVNLIISRDGLDTAWGGLHTTTLDGVQRTWGMTWMTQWTHGWVSEFGHEMGHAYGLFHSYVGDYGGAYNNYWDVMSRDEANCPPFADPVYGCYGQHTISRNKAYLGWIDPDRIAVAGPGTTTVTLERLAQPVGDGPLMVQIPIDGSPDHFFTLEYRRRIGYDDKVPGDAVIIHEIGRPWRMFQLVVPNDNSLNSEAPAAMWVTGETFNAGPGTPMGISSTGGVSVRIDALTPETATVTVRNGLSTVSKTLTPTDDTTVERSAPNTNFGSEPTLRAAPKGADNWINTRAHLKFDSAELPPTTHRVRLRLAVLDDGDATVPNRVFWSSPSWSETSLTWNNRGDLWPIGSAVTPVRDGAWVTWDVTAGLAHHGPPSYALGDGDAAWTAVYSSKEGADPPQLVIDYLVAGAPPPTATASPTPASSPTPTPASSPTPTTPGLSVFIPTNDVTVNEAKPGVNYGTEATLRVRNAQNDERSYVKFNLVGVAGTVTRATLRLYVVDAGPDGGGLYAVSPVWPGTLVQWREGELTWGNAPPISGPAVAALGAVKSGRWVEVDVTDAAQSALLDHNGRLSLTIANENTNLVAYSSKEGEHPPELVVRFNASVTPTASPTPKPTKTPTPGPTGTATPGPSPTPTATATPGPSPTPTASATPGPSPTPAPTARPPLLRTFLPVVAK